MIKQEFIAALRAKLSGVPEKEAEERIGFYAETIDDRMEEGLSEEEAVSAVGSVDDIASQIIAEISREKTEKAKIKRKRELKAWEILLLVLGSPIWLSLIIAAAAVIFSFYVVLWSVIISLWAVFVSLVACSLGVFIESMICFFCGKTMPGLAMVGAAVLCAGLSIFTFFGCMAATKGIVWLTQRSFLWIKNCFVKKEEI